MGWLRGYRDVIGKLGFRLLGYGLALTGLLFMPSVSPIQQQDEFQSLLTDLFPGNYVITLDGSLRGTYSSGEDTSEHVPDIPLVIHPAQDLPLSYTLNLYAPAVSSDQPASILRVNVSISLYDVIGQPPNTYILFNEDELDLLLDEPQITASLLVTDEATGIRTHFDEQVEGQVYVEGRILNNAYERQIAFDFSVSNHEGDTVHVRGAAYYVDVELLPRPSRGEFALALSGIAYATAEDGTLIVRADDDRYVLEMTLQGTLREAPTETVPIQIEFSIANTTLPECPPGTLPLLDSGLFSSSLTFDNVLLEGYEIDSVYSEICYESASHDSLSGEINLQLSNGEGSYALVGPRFYDVPIE